MEARLRSWWQKIKRPLLVVGIIIACVLGIALIVGIIGGYLFHWGWTGLSQKSLWDWLQLLLVPIILAVGGFWLNQIQKSREEKATVQHAEIERKAAELRAQVEREIARNARREAALPDYIDKMSELLFEKNLRRSQSGDDVRIIARVQTLTVLRELDADRKGSLLRFLYEACLINKDVKEGILNLTRADLSMANLSGANLIGASLTGADLGVADLYGANLNNADLRGTNFGEAIMIEANLSGADLSDADLNIADLSGADLSNAKLDGATLGKTKLGGAKVTPEQLKQAKSLKGATMPDGTIHP